MKQQIIKTWHLLAFALIILITPTNITYAYLDPGSGSLIIQLLVAAILGGLVTIRMFWSKILTMFGLRQPLEDDDDDFIDESSES